MKLGALGAVIVAGLVALLSVSQAHGADGALDSTFDADGIVTTPIAAGATEDVGFDVALQPDGKLVVVGRSGVDFALTRYNANGSLDTTCDGDGKLTTQVGTSDVDEARAVAIQSDGKIVVAGFANALANSGGLSGDFAVVRYNGTNCSLDTTFSGDGKVVTTVATFSGPAFALALQSDGKIVVGGRGGTSGAQIDDDFVLVRYTTGGALDPSFDGDGQVVTDVGGQEEDDQAYALAIQPDGKIVAAGFSDLPGQFVNHDFALARYNTNGSPDTTCDGDGKVTTPISTQPSIRGDEANALVVQPDGKLVAAGYSEVNPTAFALARYSGANCSLDSSFDGDGKVTTNVSPIGNTSVAYALALQPDGKLVAGGRAANFDSGTGFNHHDFALVRYSPNGSLDTTFDTDGKVTTQIAPPGQTDIVYGLAIQPDGKIVAAGYADMGPPSAFDWDFALARYVFAVGYARPKSATPVTVRLVPAFNACASANATHGGPLTYPSCNPPVQSSGFLTFNAPDRVAPYNAGASGNGFVRLKVFCTDGAGPPCIIQGGDQQDVSVASTVSDVRCVGATGGCSGAGGFYSGKLLISIGLRITDRWNGPWLTVPATVGDTALNVGLQCASGSCSTSTSADAVIPGLVMEQTRAIWRVSQVQVLDGGPDGNLVAAPAPASGTCPPACAGNGGETVFLTQGLFTP